MFKSATSYKAFLGLTLAFFFGLTLGLTLNLVGSQTSTANRTQATGSQGEVNYYCSLTRNELNATTLDTCNGVVNSQGFFGWTLVNNNHAYNMTNDGTTGTNINKENTIQIGTDITLIRPGAQLSDPQTWVKNTTCSKVQHDANGNENGDIFMQYIVDANNYCMIYSSNTQGKTQRLNRCKLENLNEGTLTYWDNDQANDHPDYQPLKRLKEMYDQKCVPPSPTPDTRIPTASLNTRCTANQATGADNLSYEMRMTNIFTPGGFDKNRWMLCLDKTKPGAATVVSYFNGKAWWQNNTYACYGIGDGNGNVDNIFAIPANSQNPNDIWMRLGAKVTNDSVGNRNYLYTRTNGNVDPSPKTFSGLADFTKNNNIENVHFQLRAELWSDNGQLNDQIQSTYIPSASGIKINPTACVNPTNTPTTISPTITTTACTSSKTVEKNLPIQDYLGDLSGHRSMPVQPETLANLDYTKPIYIAVDWGWTGKPVNDPVSLPPSIKNPQRGPVNLPSTENDKLAEKSHQTNEISDVKINFFNKTSPNNPVLYGTINCPDIGEWSNGDELTRFSDGRTVVFNSGLTTNLKDVIAGGGDWFTCRRVRLANGSLTANLMPVKSTQRPDNSWFVVNLNEASHSNKLQFEKVFIGGPSTNAPDSAADKGSHYTKVTVKYCTK